MDGRPGRGQLDAGGPQLRVGHGDAVLRGFGVTGAFGARGAPGPFVVIAMVVVVAVAVSVFFYPLWTAQLEDWEFIRLHYWIPSWK